MTHRTLVLGPAGPATRRGSTAPVTYVAELIADAGRDELLLVDDLATWLTGVLDLTNAWEGERPTGSSRRSPAVRRGWWRWRSASVWCRKPDLAGFSGMSSVTATPGWPRCVTRCGCSSPAYPYDSTARGGNP